MKRLLMLAVVVGGAMLVVVVVTAIQTVGKGPQPIVSTKDGFQLAWPGQGWTLLREEDARKLMPNASAGVVHQELGLVAYVIVEPGTADLEKLLQLAMEQFSLTDRNDRPVEKTVIQGEPALRRHVSGKGKDNGEPHHGEITVFLHNGRFYRIFCVGKESPTAADGSAFRPVTEAFSFLAVPAPTAPTATKSADPKAEEVPKE